MSRNIIVPETSHILGSSHVSEEKNSLMILEKKIDELYKKNDELIRNSQKIRRNIPISFKYDIMNNPEDGMKNLASYLHRKEKKVEARNLYGDLLDKYVGYMDSNLWKVLSKTSSEQERKEKMHCIHIGMKLLEKCSEKGIRIRNEIKEKLEYRLYSILLLKMNKKQEKNMKKEQYQTLKHEIIKMTRMLHNISNEAKSWYLASWNKIKLPYYLTTSLLSIPFAAVKNFKPKECIEAKIESLKILCKIRYRNTYKEIYQEERYTKLHHDSFSQKELLKNFSINTSDDHLTRCITLAAA